MFSLKRCVLGIGLGIFGCAAGLASPPLTVVQDILFNADGTPFSGVARISWPSFQASDTSNIQAHTISSQIVNGLLRVQLVPTTNALSPASYNVLYTNSSGAQFSENWAVPPSNSPVRVSTIRIGASGTSVGTSGTSGGASNNAVAAAATVNIADVNGLTSALNLRATIGTAYSPSRAAVIDATGSLEAAAGALSDCLHVDGTSGACGTGGGTTTNSGPIFVDGEIPSGAIDGVNSTFALGNAPTPPASLMLYRNGELLRNGTDFGVSNNQVIFVSTAIPQVNDILIASYRIGANTSGITFIDGETPAGATDGSNLIFTLAQAPNPISSLALFRNGLRLRANLDYMLAGSQITFQPGLAPQVGDVLQVSYRLGGAQ